MQCPHHVSVQGVPSGRGICFVDLEFVFHCLIQPCLGWWEFGRSGLAAGQIKVNQTQVYDQMGHPVPILHKLLSQKDAVFPHLVGHFPFMPLLLR